VDECKPLFPGVFQNHPYPPLQSPPSGILIRDLSEEEGVLPPPPPPLFSNGGGGDGGGIGSGGGGSGMLGESDAFVKHMMTRGASLAVAYTRPPSSST